MPAQSPSAFAKHCPKTMPVSSIKWCSSTQRSPFISPERSKRPCLQNDASKCVKKPMGFFTSYFPLPSRFNVSSICVSRVLRCMVAVLLIMQYSICFYVPISSGEMLLLREKVCVTRQGKAHPLSTPDTSSLEG